MDAAGVRSKSNGSARVHEAVPAIGPRRSLPALPVAGHVRRSDRPARLLGGSTLSASKGTPKICEDIALTCAHNRFRWIKDGRAGAASVHYPQVHDIRLGETS